MKRFLILLVATLTILPLATSALAGGPPPKDILKGVFISADAANHTAVFKKDGSGETVTLTVPDSISFEEVQLERKMLVDLDKHAPDPNTVKHISIMFMNMTRTKVIALIVIGLIGGLLSGFIGSGGAFVLTPAMMSLGAPGAVAVASNMCHKFPKAMVGTYKRFKYGQVDIKLAAVMAVTAVLGVQIGIQIQKYILNHWGNAGSNLYVSVVFVLVLILVGGYVMMDAIKLSKG
ncbi:MAG: sulfite exporter TauE/SafE family protein, partial [Desulfobulbaceae bacterium]|nr:sulfite exporter TauE/SafE family protein [Desulfobulbaceae bacterium]